MKISERDNPFYRPLWRRIAIVAVVGAWAAWEVIYVKDSLWTMIALFFLGYAVWMFFITYRAPVEPKPPAEE
jgi:hypothetical protein